MYAFLPILWVTCVAGALSRRPLSGPVEFECYSCYSRSSLCGHTMNAAEMTAVSKQKCRTKCFLRIDGPTVFRDCFDGWVGGMVDSSYVGCRSQYLQGKSMEWCFCEGHLCNGASRKDLSNILRQVEAPINMFRHTALDKPDPKRGTNTRAFGKRTSLGGSRPEQRARNLIMPPRRKGKLDNEKNDNFPSFNEDESVKIGQNSFDRSEEADTTKYVLADEPNVRENGNQLNPYVATPSSIPEIKSGPESASHLIEDGGFVEEGYSDGVSFTVNTENVHRPSFQPIETSYSEGIRCYSCTSNSPFCSERVKSGAFLSTTLCKTKCYTRRENGHMFRGCFDGWIGSVVHSDYIGCQKQTYRHTDVTWCFCGTDYCNEQSIEQLGRRLNPSYVNINSKHVHGYGGARTTYEDEPDTSQSVGSSYNRRLYGVDPIPMYAKPMISEVNPQDDDSTLIRVQSACFGKPDGPHADPLDCAAFIHCSHGIGYKKYCPPGTVWDSRMKHCNFSKMVFPSCDVSYQ